MRMSANVINGSNNPGLTDLQRQTSREIVFEPMVRAVHGDQNVERMNCPNQGVSIMWNAHFDYSESVADGLKIGSVRHLLLFQQWTRLG